MDKQNIKFEVDLITKKNYTNKDNVEKYNIILNKEFSTIKQSKNGYKCYRHWTHSTTIKWQVFQPHKQHSHRCTCHVHWKC